MLDINFIRENKNLVKKAVKLKCANVDIEKLLVIDDERRKLLLKVENLRAEKNAAAKEKNIERGKKIKKELEKIENDLSKIKKEFQKNLLQVPNIALPNVPTGDETKNKILKKVGQPFRFNFPVKDHLTLGENLDIIDVVRASKLSGSRFGYLKNKAVLLEFALINFAIERLSKEGFSPIIPPVLIKKEITEKLGYWQAGGNENYYLVVDYKINKNGQDDENPFYLIGTAEHSLVPMHKDEIFTEKELPKKYVGFSSCFRREAGSYGKDTKGIFRVHQFDKIEMVEYVMPQDDEKERRKMLAFVEGMMRELELPYQVVQLASGDLSFPSAETIDIETWIPSQNKYRETHSISTTTDFQARRLNIRYKKGGKTEFVHLLNGTAFAIGRTIIAILENYQQKDGSVKIPKVLRPYLGFDIIK